MGMRHPPRIGMSVGVDSKIMSEIVLARRSKVKEIIQLKKHIVQGISDECKLVEWLMSNQAADIADILEVFARKDEIHRRVLVFGFKLANLENTERTRVPVSRRKSKTFTHNTPTPARAE